MSKKRRGNKSLVTKYGYGVAPEFIRHIEETHGNVVDLGNAPDGLRLSDRILRLIDPYMDSMDIIVLVDCAAIAWNECIAEDFGIKGSYSLNNALLNYANYKDLIDLLKSRKRSMFHDNRRHIKEVKACQIGEDMSINVASDYDIETAFAEILSAMDD